MRFLCCGTVCRSCMTICCRRNPPHTAGPTQENVQSGRRGLHETSTMGTQGPVRPACRGSRHSRPRKRRHASLECRHAGAVQADRHYVLAGGRAAPLSHILLRGWGPWHRRWGWRSERWRRRMEERLAAMSPEEREKFKAEWQHSCGHGFGDAASRPSGPPPAPQAG